jgi:hypothetical protein
MRTYFQSQGINTIHQRGDEHDCLCPFHDDKRPSFGYNEKTGLWKCQACGEGGNIFQFHMKLHNCDFKTAVAEISRITDVSHLIDGNQSRVVKKQYDDNLKTIPESEITKAHEALLGNEKALKFLEERRGWNIDVIKRLKLGYDRHRVLIPIYDADGNLVNIRRYSPSGQQPKIIHWKKGYGQARWWPIEHLQLDGVLICEGEPDTILACQLGLPAITHTAGAETFKAEWAPLFTDKRVYICYDNDPAGKNGAEKAANIISKTAAEVRIIELPVKNEKDDFTDWVLQGGTVEQFQELMSQAEIYQPTEQQDISIEEQIEAIPPEINFEEHRSAWQKLIRGLVKKRPAERERYIRMIKDRFKLSVSVIRDEIKLEELNAKIEPAIPTPLDTPRQPGFVLAQDMINSVFHYGIWLPTNKEEFVFRLVTSEKKLVEVPDNVEPYQIPKDFARWSVDRKTPYNVFDYLSGKADVDASELFTEIRSFIEKYMWYPDERIYTLLAIWIMQTYVFMIFDQVGYLALIGTKRAGKTRLLEILELLSFNGRLAASISDAYLFRSVEVDRTTMLVDEADQLKAPAKDGINEKLEIIRSGYRRSGSVGRIEGEDRSRVDFSTYSMKAIANVSGLEDALEDRAIDIPVERKPSEIRGSKLVRRRVERKAQVIRNKLYCFGLQYAEKVAEIYDGVQIEDVTDREEELWAGLVCIAYLIGQDIVDMLIQLAKESSAKKTVREGLESVEAQEIMALSSLILAFRAHIFPAMLSLTTFPAFIFLVLDSIMEIKEIIISLRSANIALQSIYPARALYHLSPLLPCMVITFATYVLVALGHISLDAPLLDIRVGPAL